MSGEYFPARSSDSIEPDKAHIIDQAFRNLAYPHVENYLNEDRSDLNSVFEDIFRQSFKFSNGSPTLQGLFQVQALHSVVLRGDVGGIDDIASVALECTLAIDKFLPPKQHITGRPMERMTQRLPAIWDLYVDLAVNLDNLARVQPKDKVGAKALWLIDLFGNAFTVLPYVTTFRLALAEQRYMRIGRPGRIDESTKYSSHLRRHGVQGISTGNPEFNFILAQAGVITEVIDSTEPDDMPEHWIFKSVKKHVSRLKLMWEERNPGQSFL